MHALAAQAHLQGHDPGTSGGDHRFRDAEYPPPTPTSLLPPLPPVQVVDTLGNVSC